MSFAATIPPRVGQIPAATLGLLDVTSMRTLLGGTGRVVTISGTLPVLSATKIARLVIMRRNTGSMREHLDRVKTIDLNIRLDSIRPVDGFDLDLYHERVHAEVFTLIEGVTPTLTLASVIHPYRRLEHPTAPVEDTAEHFYYSRSLYRIAVKPA